MLRLLLQGFDHFLQVSARLGPGLMLRELLLEMEDLAAQVALKPNAFAAPRVGGHCGLASKPIRAFWAHVW